MGFPIQALLGGVHGPQYMKEHEPELYARTHVVLQVKDYAAHKLSGAHATDYSDVSGTNLFDLELREWARDLMEAVGLDPDLLPADLHLCPPGPEALLPHRNHAVCWRRL